MKRFIPTGGVIVPISASVRRGKAVGEVLGTGIHTTTTRHTSPPPALTARAKRLSIMVISPRIFEAECRTPRQIQLANAFCRFLEMARTASL